MRLADAARAALSRPSARRGAPKPLSVATPQRRGGAGVQGRPAGVGRKQQTHKRRSACRGRAAAPAAPQRLFRRARPRAASHADLRALRAAARRLSTHLHGWRESRARADYLHRRASCASNDVAKASKSQAQLLARWVSGGWRSACMRARCAGPRTPYPPSARSERAPRALADRERAIQAAGNAARRELVPLQKEKLLTQGLKGAASCGPA